MDDRATKFRKFIEDLPRLCSPTICGTLSQPTTKAERNNRSDKFEWSLEQKAILSPANITTATCSDIGEMDHSFLHQESEQFFSQKTIAPSPMTTPSTRNYSRSQPVSYKFNNHMFDERDEDSDDDDDDDDDDDRSNSDSSSNSGKSGSSDSDTDIDMEVLHDDEQEDDDDDDVDRTSDSDSETDTDRDEDEDEDMTDEYDNDDADNARADQQQDMDTLFLSPPLRSSQSQQRVDIFSPESFTRVMEDECTLQSTPKTIGSQISRTRTRRDSEMSD
jgi:hypothetical protein